MKLIRRQDHGNSVRRPGWPQALNPRLDRRNFLRAAGLGGLAASMTAGLVKETEAAQDPGALNLPSTGASQDDLWQLCGRLRLRGRGAGRGVGGAGTLVRASHQSRQPVLQGRRGA